MQTRMWYGIECKLAICSYNMLDRRMAFSVTDILVKDQS